MSNENITFFLKEKDDNKTNNDEIDQMMEELNEHINASELNPWIINDTIEEDVNPFFNGALSANVFLGDPIATITFNSFIST